MNEQHKLLLVDGSALLHRAYHAMPGLTDRKGRPTGAMYGFVRMLLRAIKDLQPTHVAVAFDRPEPTFRKQLYIAYQAQRPEVPEDLVDQFICVRELLAAMEVPVYEKAGYEADDILGSIAAIVSQKPKVNPSTSSGQVSLRARNQKYKLKIKNENSQASTSTSLSVKIQNSDEKNLETSKPRNFETIILTGDKDLMQLVNEHVKLYLPVKGVSEAELVGSPEVEEKLGVKPEQVVDYKALTGDPSDNYPGVPGVGPKTAVGLLKEFGSFEETYEALGEHTPGGVILTDSVRQKLLLGKDAGELSRKLAQIRTDVDVNFDIAACEAVVKQPGHLARVLEDFGFTSLVKQMELETAVGQGMEQMKLV